MKNDEVERVKFIKYFFRKCWKCGKLHVQYQGTTFYIIVKLIYLLFMNALYLKLIILPRAEELSLNTDHFPIKYSGKGVELSRLSI